MSNEHDEQQEEGLQMSFLDHLDELRKRLVYAVISVAIAFSVCFLFSEYIFKFLEKPVVAQLQKQRKAVQKNYGQADPTAFADGEQLLYTFTEETAVAGVKIPLGTTIRVRKTTIDGKPTLVLAERWVVAKSVLPPDTPIERILKEGEDALRYDDESNQLVLTGVTSAFMIYIQVSIYAGIALAVPFLFFQIWAFISPGLYKHEKKYLTPVVLMGTFFFLAGTTFAYRIAFPAAADYLLGLALDGGFRTLLNAEEYLNLIIMIMLGMGIVFQIPTLSFILGRIGLLTPGMMLKAWRYAIVIIMVVAAVLTPTPDVSNLMLFAGPMILLYFFSIGIVWIFGKPRQTDAEVEALAHKEATKTS